MLTEPFSQQPPENPEDDMVVPNDTELPYTFKLSEVTAEQKQGGSVKIVDSKTFKISTAISAAVVEVEVGGLRELHVRSFLGSASFLADPVALSVAPD